MGSYHTNTRRAIHGWGLVLFLLAFGLLMLRFPQVYHLAGVTTGSSGQLSPQAQQFQNKLIPFAQENGLALSQWPDDLLEAAARNPEMEDFVMQYPLQKDSSESGDMQEYENSQSVPLLMQWDARWGYTSYADAPLGLSGCGPTCLSMVSMYLLQDTSWTPDAVARFSEDNGYSIPGGGSSWTLISEGGQLLGMDVTEIPLDRRRVMDALTAGQPIICAMGPGDFTTTGHFIVMTGCQDGKIKINDPNSKARSGQLWEYDQIQAQIKNLWVLRK